MPFLVVTCFLMYAHLFAAVRLASRNANAGRGSSATRMFMAGHVLSCMAAVLGFLLGSEILTLDRDGGIAGDAFNWSPGAYLVFGALSLVIFGTKFYAKYRRHVSKQEFGPAVIFSLWAAVGGAYVSFTTIDHFMFFRDREHSGQMAVSFSGERLDCSGDMLLVRIDGNIATYRCPQTIRLGRDYAAPFVPWPSYVEGTSVKLKARIDAVMDQVSKERGVVVVPAGKVKIRPNIETN
ncbi:hypothetical protein [Burkholderia stabilis]|uniref:hypothetical protein n=1 Tax=Burkholderia stabilis TaxID=95485 RepID=UPI001F4B7CE8|nr:hypothetical protein [Burkholderia stabilis]